MFNRLTSIWSEQSPAHGNWHDLDRNPQGRLILLWLAMLLPILVIGGRVAQLQLGLKDDFAAAFSLTTETVEEIPARDGRIFAADGTSILAGDVQRYDVAVHYPAIVDTPDDRWITSKAKPRLSKRDRRDKAKVAAEKQKVIAENEQLWTKLAGLTNRPVNELMESRKREQERVERIKKSVERRHFERHSEVETTAEPDRAQFDSLWFAVWQRIQQALTEPPERYQGPRLITEELEYCPVITDITADMRDEIEAHPDRYPYTRILVSTRRTYPQGELASHLIGARRPLSVEEIEKRKHAFPGGDPQDYRVGDSRGLFGLERSYDILLKGVRGQRAIVKNRRGEIVDTRIVRDPQHGRDLVLTLDIDVQRRSEQLLDKALKHVTLVREVDTESTRVARREPTCPKGGCIVALDVHTGAILAAATAPRYDLNMYVSPDSELWDDAMLDKRSPLFSRVTDMGLPPGSVFKVISAVASIESGTMPASALFHCQGYLDRPSDHRCYSFLHQKVGHNDVTLADALCRSCNVYFFAAARRMGPQPIVDWARQFGIGQRTGIDLPSESTGHLPSPDLTVGKRRSSWKPGDTLGLAIGQSSLEVTPLQMARVMAAIANDGYLVSPHLARHSGPAVMSESESSRNLLNPSELRPIHGLHRETLDHVREGLTMVVHDPRGTAYKTVRMKEVTIAGKTGTAQTSGDDHAWFAGYVPAERPKIAFVVVLEHGGGGGKAAGPLAHDFVKALIERKLIETSADVAAGQVQQIQSMQR